MIDSRQYRAPFAHCRVRLHDFFNLDSQGHASAVAIGLAADRVKQSVSMYVDGPSEITDGHVIEQKEIQ